MPSLKTIEKKSGNQGGNRRDEVRGSYKRVLRTPQVLPSNPSSSTPTSSRISKLWGSLSAVDVTLKPPPHSGTRTLQFLRKMVAPKHHGMRRRYRYPLRFPTCPRFPFFFPANQQLFGPNRTTASLAFASRGNNAARTPQNLNTRQIQLKFFFLF
ncbi:hypothetical protein HPP92_016522 [Vanilla planifolia]|uniref:Uncharacterized protein n=1 Tax=Vanilla planifolia TaxID=51239 RepID=A0A835UQ29_VANPL|nr:hypothetical protein HPP92_016522 [Vanilla planifolia]